MVWLLTNVSMISTQKKMKVLKMFVIASSVLLIPQKKGLYIGMKGCFFILEVAFVSVTIWEIRSQ